MDELTWFIKMLLLLSMALAGWIVVFDLHAVQREEDSEGEEDYIE